MRLHSTLLCQILNDPSNEILFHFYVILLEGNVCIVKFANSIFYYDSFVWWNNFNLHNCNG